MVALLSATDTDVEPVADPTVELMFTIAPFVAVATNGSPAAI